MVLEKLGRRGIGVLLGVGFTVTSLAVGGWSLIQAQYLSRQTEHELMSLREGPDFNGDGVNDLFLEQKELGCPYSNETWIMLRNADGTLSPGGPYRIRSVLPDGLSGMTVDPIPDFNGDGVDDFVVCFPQSPRRQRLYGSDDLICYAKTATQRGVLDVNDRGFLVGSRDRRLPLNDFPDGVDSYGSDLAEMIFGEQ